MLNADFINMTIQSNEARLKLMNGVKHGHYSGPSNRLQNFRDINTIMNIMLSYSQPMEEDAVIELTDSQTAVTMMLKHFVRFLKIIGSREHISYEICNEVFGDLQNYIDLIKALYIDEDKVNG